ncbi:hypothetical protein NHX12_000590 [Muraenolepis orangiensis]|uniref:HAT C-terminal dimerisation domain-containing protein n=1 Tax=Muraenolepis orangiensis TaxID=630683 RepID=A0A9Q0D692_9TELE|nr:hypothetical protein NHX12_000590 [Muraenolepis orangiensis]
MCDRQFGEVMSLVIRVINFIVARALNDRQFKTLLDEVNNYPGLLLHSNVRWLSRGKVLSRFAACLNEIRTFLEMKGVGHPELADTEWLLKFYYLVDLTEHLNQLNVKMQGIGNTVLSLQQAVFAFENKLELFITDLETGRLLHFEKLSQFKDACTASEPIQNLDLHQLAGCTSSLLQSFKARFGEFREHTRLFKFITHPNECSLNTADLNYIPGVSVRDFEAEVADLKASDILFMTHGQAAQSPDSNRIAECVCLRLLKEYSQSRNRPKDCKGKTLPIPQAVVHTYNHIKQLLEDSRAIQDQTNLVLVTINNTTVACWWHGRQKRTNRDSLLQGVELPQKLSVATESLLEARELPSAPVEHGHDVMEFQEPENREGEAVIRSPTSLKSRAQDELAELSMDRSLKLKHGELRLDIFWLLVGHEYPSLSESAIKVLLQFPTSYLCELAFSSLAYVKNKTRTRLSVEQDLRVALSTIPPRIKRLCSQKQAQVSH